MYLKELLVYVLGHIVYKDGMFGEGAVKEQSFCMLLKLS